MCSKGNIVRSQKGVRNGKADICGYDYRLKTANMYEQI